jgi:hypothetical protein
LTGKRLNAARLGITLAYCQECDFIALKPELILESRAEGARKIAMEDEWAEGGATFARRPG